MASTLVRDRMGNPVPDLRRRSVGLRIASIGMWIRRTLGRLLGADAADGANGPEQLGRRAVRLGLATEEQVSVALSQQRERACADATSPPLGALMVQMGVLVPTQLAHLLSKVANGFQLSPDAVRLAVSLQNVMATGAQSIVFTGVRREDGAALLAAQVGLALALMDRGPLTIVDCDRQQPSIESLLGLPALPDGRNAPHRRGPGRDTGIPGLSIASAGQCDGVTLSELIGEANLGLLDQLRRMQRFTLLSAPPAIRHPETAIIASRADATVIVARAGVTRANDIATVERLMSAVNARVFGIVLSSYAH